MKSVLRKFGPAGALVAAIFAAYSQIFSFAFLYDDEFLIQKNRFLDSFSSLADIFTKPSTAGAGYTDAFYRPMQGFAYLLIQQLFGREPVAFHALNLSLHILNALLIWQLGRRLKLPPAAAWCAALLWALHPIHTEGVTYMSSTADSMHVMFMLSGLLVLLPDFSWRRVPVPLMFAFLGMLSKESAVIFPALLVTLIFFLDKHRRSWRAYRITLPFWLASFAYLGLRAMILAQNGVGAMYKEPNIYTQNWIYRAMTFLATLPGYLELLIFPHDLHMDRAFPVYVSPAPVVIAGFALALAVLALIILAWRKPTAGRLWAAWVGLWFFVAQAPQSGILIPANSFFLEHWMYLPSVSLFLGVGALLARAWRAESRPWLSYATAGGVAVAAVALSVATLLQNEVWTGPISLYSHILKYNPAADRVRHNLAMAYSDLGESDRAMQEYQTVLSHTDRYPATFHNVARLYLDKGDLDRAEQSELKALQLDSRFFPAYSVLAEISDRRGDHAKAEEYKKKFQEAFR